MTDIVLSIVMLAALALVAGAFVLWRRTGEVRNPALMVLLAVIAVANVLIWTLPTATGEVPIEQIRAAGEE
jgi:drug/metabolite transporter superfamily protein YnfA